MTPTMTLADLAATSSTAVRILEQHGLDYCCGGKQSLGKACSAKGIEPEAVMHEIQEANSATATGRGWQTAPLAELAQHILATHHEYLKLNLPALGNRMAKVLSAHGNRDSEALSRLSNVLASLSAELEMHLRKEEMVLFPFIQDYARAASENRPMPPVPFGTIANPIAMMEREHSGAGDALAEIRSLTHGFEPPAYACNTMRALYEGLRELESDLHTHIHLENNILFPRAIALENH